jgi:hypothetical protein
VLPPILEIYVVWHPADKEGAVAAAQIVEHFHGTAFSGLIGGAIEVYVRSAGWQSPDDAPRPLPLPGTPSPTGIPRAQLTAVVPVVGNELSMAVDSGGAWRTYVAQLVQAAAEHHDRVFLFPLVVDRQAAEGTALAELLGPIQAIAAPSGGVMQEPEAELRNRDLAQFIAQRAGGIGGDLSVVFISHTMRSGWYEEAGLHKLIDQVQWVINRTRLKSFFDARDLQSGELWEPTLRASAATSALLSVRSDLYASRSWCQREMLIAKQENMPVVILDALQSGEERGSFLMDHVPRVPVRMENLQDSTPQWRDADIRRGLNLLVDECLKRVLWRYQEAAATANQELAISWWAAHAPEPTTLAHWLNRQKALGGLAADRDLRILHPDPPLGPDERAVLEEIARLAGITGEVDLMTPRSLAARGG